MTVTPPGSLGSTTNVYTAGQITQQTDPASDITAYAYAGTNSTFAGGTTTITVTPVSGTTEVTTDQFSANLLIEQTTGAASASAASLFFQIDPVSLQPLWNVDGDGNVTYFTYQAYSATGGTPISSNNLLTTDAAGDTTDNVYNSFNQAWCTIDAADYANGVTLPIQPAWPHLAPICRLPCHDNPQGVLRGAPERGVVSLSGRGHHLLRRGRQSGGGD